MCNVTVLRSFKFWFSRLKTPSCRFLRGWKRSHVLSISDVDGFVGFQSSKAERLQSLDFLQKQPGAGTWTTGLKRSHCSRDSLEISHHCFCCLVLKSFPSQCLLYCLCFHFFSVKNASICLSSHCYFRCCLLVTAISGFPWLPFPF